MIKFIVAVASLALRSPDVGTFRDINWKPEFTEPSELRLVDSTIAVLTHCSQRFDPLRQTAPAVHRVVADMKSRSLPVLYLHDKYNSLNPGWCYLYDDWVPMAFISSDVGNVDFDLSNVEHAVCLGGFFEQCERSTVTDLARLWRRDRKTGDFRITQVVDATFNVLAYVNFSDPYNDRVRDFFREKQSRHPKAVVGLDQVLSHIEDNTLVPGFLQRQLSYVSSDVNIVMDIFERIHVLQWVGPQAPTLTFAYRKSEDFLEFKTPVIPPSQPLKRWFRGNSGR